MYIWPLEVLLILSAGNSTISLLLMTDVKYFGQTSGFSLLNFLLVTYIYSCNKLVLLSTSDVSESHLGRCLLMVEVYIVNDICGQCDSGLECG